MSLRRLALLFALVAASGCGGDPSSSTDAATLADAGPDAGPDAAPDRAPDAGADAGADAALDTEPPDTRITEAPPADDNAIDTRFVFSSEDGARFECARDGAALADCTSPHAVTGLADGAHVFTVRAIDAAGNPDPSPASHAWTVDASTPDTRIDGGPDGTVASRTASVAFSSPDAGAGATFTCAVDGSAFAACASPYRLADLSEGDHTLAVRVRDAAGNLDPSPATRTWTVDVTPPALTLAGPDGGIDGAVAHTTPTFTFVATDRGAVATRCHIDGATAEPCTSPFTALPLGEGAHTLTVTASDAAGLTASATVAFTVDTIAPVLTVTGPAGAIEGAVDDTTPTIAFSAVDSVAVTFRCSVGGVEVQCTSPHTTEPLAQGWQAIIVTATDAVGHATNRTLWFAVDTADPVISLTAPSGTITTRTPTLRFPVTDTTPTTLACQVDEVAATPCASPFTAPSLADGPHTFTITATDRVGRTATASAAFRVDATGPAAVITRAPPPGWPLPSFAFELGLVAPEPGAWLLCSVDGAAFTACTSPRAVEVALGVEHHFAVRGIDSLGNLGPEATAAWTPTGGLVLHYPLDRDAENHSILAPDYPLDPAPTFGGGYAGGAAAFREGAGIRGSETPLSTRTGYTIALWAVTPGAGAATLFTNRGGTEGGCTVGVEASTLSLVCDGAGVGELGRVDGFFQAGEWGSVVVRYAAPGAAVELWINGELAGAIPNPSGAEVFTPRQRRAAIPAMPAGYYLDDVRIYNRSFTDAALCTDVLLGVVAAGRCVVPRPGLRYSFEDIAVDDHWTIRNVGTWLVFLFGYAASEVAVGPAVLGDGITFPTGADRSPVLSGAELVRTSVDHTVSLWFRAPAGPGVLLDQRCGPDPVCDGDGGLAVEVDGEHLRVCGVTPATGERCTAVPFTPGRWTHLMITSQGGRDGNAVVTDRLVVHLDGEVRGAVPFGGAGNVFGNAAAMALPRGLPGVALDELAIWPLDLSRRPDTFCRLGLGGDLDEHGSCALPPTP